MHELAFRRQFFAAPHPVAEFAHWRRVRIGALELHAHPDLELTTAAGDGPVRLALVGFALDPAAPELDDRGILDRLAASARRADEVPELARDLAGRWVLVAEDGERTVVVNDPCGLRSVHHALRPEGAYLATNPALLGRLVPLSLTAGGEAYLASAYRHRAVEHWLPSGTTLYAGAGHLVPNHFLHVETGEQVRFWPTNPVAPRSVEEAAAGGAALLRALLDAAGRRFPLALPLTAGWDSRALLGAARGGTDELFAYTLVYRDLHAASPDVAIPSAILAHAGMKHHVIEATALPPAEFVDVCRANVDLPHDDWIRIAWGLLRGYPGERVCLKGNAAEIARNMAFSEARAEPTARGLAELSFEGLSFVEEGLRPWFESARAPARAAGIDLVDLFYWEHYMGSWQARSQLEWDVAQEAFTPFAHRPLLTLLLGVPWRQRRGPRYLLWRALHRYLWPDLARWPVNPVPAAQRARNLARALLERAGVLVAVRGAYRRLRARSR